MKKIKIGNIEIEKTAALAPMASVADKAYRYMCKKFGASYVVGEMASAKGMFYSDRKTAELLEVTDFEYPMAVQIFGDEPKYMAYAAEKTLQYKPAIIDINMGCPVPKVAGNGCGSALMKNPKLAGEIVKAVVNSVDIPVTVKFRKGWDDNNVNAVEFAKIMEQNGASAVVVHGRTREQMYRLPIDIDIIKQVKQNVSIPVIGNGGIVDVKTAVEMYDKTGCDLIMIGQGTYGKPWIFNQIKTYLETGEILSEPNLKQRFEIMLEHIKLICEFKGEYVGMKEARKHTAWYLKGLHSAARFRKACEELNKFEDVENLVKVVLQENE